MASIEIPSVQQLATPERPWLGLRAYTLETAAYFYGRERETDELFRRIKLEPLTLLYGKSGLGKTSLLGAGLLPRLKVEGRRPVLIRLRFDTDSPALLAQVRAELALALDQLEADLGTPLWQHAFHPQMRRRVELERPVLIIDQFEEAFTLAVESRDLQGQIQRRDRRDEIAQLMTEFAALIERRPPGDQPAPEGYDWTQSALRLVLTLRDDYLHELERWKKLIPALMRNRVELRELRGPQALDAVLLPARKGQQALIEIDVAQQLVCFVAKRDSSTPLDEIEAVPPLLSLLCAELNAARVGADAAQITQAQLHGEADHVLERFYQRSFDGMPSGVRRAVEDLLIDNSGRIREASSRDTVLSEMQRHGVRAPQDYLRALVDGRVLTIEERAGAPRVELTHDLLVPMVARSREGREAEEKAEREHAEAERLAAFERARLESVNLVLCVAARRALGRARDSLELGEIENYAAYLAESLGYSPVQALSEAMVAVQRLASPGIANAFATDPAVLAVCWSRDCSRIVTHRQGGVAQVWNPYSGAKLGESMQHDHEVEFAKFSPDGSRILTASRDNTARLWNAESGAPIGVEMQHGSWIKAAFFSQNGAKIVTLGGDAIARIWDGNTGSSAVSAKWEASQRRMVEGLQHDSEVIAACFSPDNLYLITGSADHTARLWDVHNCVPVGALMRHVKPVTQVAFSPDGRRTMTISGNIAWIWDSRTGQPLGEPIRHDGRILSATFSPDSRCVAISGDDKTAQVWSIFTKFEKGAVIAHHAPVVLVIFSSDSRLIMTASGNVVQIWNSRNGHPIGASMLHDGDVISAQLSQDCRFLVSATRTCALTWFWNVGSALPALLRHQQGVWFANFSSDGRRVVTLSNDGLARLWDVNSCKSVGSPMVHDDAVASASFSPDSKYILTTSRSNSTKMWSAVTGVPIGRERRSGLDMFGSAVSSPNGRRFLTIGEDATVRQWERGTWAEVGVPMTHLSQINSAAFSPNGSFIVTAGADKTARLWRAETGESAQISPMVHNGSVISASFSPDGMWVVTASEDNFVRIWSVESGLCHFPAMRHEGKVTVASFSPDGRHIITASVDKSARIWNASTGLALGPPMVHDAAVLSANFSPDGSQIVTASLDGTARIWEVPSFDIPDKAVACVAAAIQLLGGKEVGEDGRLRWLTPSAVLRRREEIRLPPNLCPRLSQIVKWHLSRATARPISPFARLTVSDHIEREIQWSLMYPDLHSSFLLDAYILDPGHPLILLALSVSEDCHEIKALWKCLSFPRIDANPDYAARAAEILRLDKDAFNAKRAARIALKRDPNDTRAQIVLDWVNAGSRPGLRQ